MKDLKANSKTSKIKEKYIFELDNSIKDLLKNTIQIFKGNFSYLIFLLKTFLRQKKAIKKRTSYENKGLHVPPFLITSITSKCNLRCKGCYAHINNLGCQSELPTEKWDSIFREATELGISFILLAGGEPFVRYDIINCAGKYKKIIFPIFTNSTLLTKEKIKLLKKYKNLIPIISIEGSYIDTDFRRGKGISQSIEKTINALKVNRNFYGLSFTVTNENFATITDDNFIEEYIYKGCKLFFFVEYVPIERGTEDLVINQKQRESLDIKLEELRKKYRALFISFPGDEKKYGGCLSSGRGFIHISPDGKLEPCPFSPYSDMNLKDITLKEALKSEFLEKIRNSKVHLSETENGCALFNKKEWVQSLLKK